MSNEFRAAIGDIGPSSAPNGRARARLHYVALAHMRKYPFERNAGEALCNPNLTIDPAAFVTAEEATCSKCLTRADRHGIRIVTTTSEADHTPPATTGH